MSRISDLKHEGMKAGPCFACQGEADAMWMGGGDWFICIDCAESILPALLADAVCQQNINPQQALEKATARFWFACYWNAKADRERIQRETINGKT